MWTWPSTQTIPPESQCNSSGTILTKVLNLNFRKKVPQGHKTKKKFLLWAAGSVGPRQTQWLNSLYTVTYKRAKYSNVHKHTVCTQVIVQYHYQTDLQQENNRYSICTKQISKAVQFIRANYGYIMLEVISTHHILHSFRHRPSALLWIKVLPARLHNGLLV